MTDVGDRRGNGDAGAARRVPDSIANQGDHDGQDNLGNWKVWRKRGREHGRRAVPGDAGCPHPVPEQIRAALLELAANRCKAMLYAIGPLDGERERLHGERERLLSGTATTPPGRERQAAEAAVLGNRLASLDRERSMLCQVLERELDELHECARQADAAFREGYKARDRWKGAGPAEADLSLPDYLRGPIPDPLEGDPA